MLYMFFIYKVILCSNSVPGWTVSDHFNNPVIVFSITTIKFTFKQNYLYV